MTEHTAGPVTSTAGTLGGDGPLRVVRGPAGEPAFDEHRPPSAELVADCVHCGFCLPTCPTYVAVGRGDGLPARADLPDERGPAGRADDARDGAALRRLPRLHGLRDRLPLGRAVRQAHRGDPRPGGAALRPARRPTGRCATAIFALFPYPRRLRADARAAAALPGAPGCPGVLRKSGVLQRISPTIAAMESIAPPLERPEPVPQRTPARGHAPRHRRPCCSGCVQREFFPGVNAATARVLAAEGFDVVAPASQGCCGALSAHNGREDEAQRFARALIDELRPGRRRLRRRQLRRVRLVDEGVRRPARRRPRRTPERARAFADKVRDVRELLVEVGPVAPRHPLPVTVAYHDACHLGHAQGIRSQPRELLRGIPGLEVREIADSELCCGSRRDLQPPQPRARARARRPQGRQRAAHRRASCWSRPTPAA